MHASKFKARLSPADTHTRIQRAKRLWEPIIQEKVKDDTLSKGDIIPVTSGADATPVPANPRYCNHRNIVVGVCGPITAGHKCTMDPPVQIQDGEAGFNQIVEIIRSNVWASYVYVVILQPQVDWLPSVHVCIYATCNCYDHKPHLEKMWDDIRHNFATVMKDVSVMLTGKGADGDPKERTMFLQQMYSRWRDRHHPRLSSFSSPLSNTSSWVTLRGAKGFRMRAEMTADGKIRGVHAQDPIHVCKKLDCKLDSAKVLELGYFTCCHGHLQKIYDVDVVAGACIRRAQLNGNSSGLWKQDVYKQDRQNFMACVRRAGYKVRRALIQCQPVGALNMTGRSPSLIKRSFLPANNADADTMPVLDAVFMGDDDLAWGSTDEHLDIKTQGTVAFYVLCAAYMLIHQSQHFGELQRVRFAGYVNMFAAHWRCWVVITPQLTLQKKF